MTESEQCAESRKYSREHIAVIVETPHGLALFTSDRKTLIGIYPSAGPLAEAFHSRPIPKPPEVRQSAKSTKAANTAKLLALLGTKP